MWLVLGVVWAGSLPVAASVDVVPVAAPGWPPVVAGLSFAGPDGADALALRSVSAPKGPASWTADVTSQAPWLVIAWSARDGQWGIGGATVVFVHGEEKTPVAMRLGLEIPLEGQPASGAGTTLVRAGGQILGVTQIRNPFPNRPLTRIQIDSKRTAGALSVYAVSLVDVPPFPVAPSDPQLTGFPFVIQPAGPPLPQPDDLRVSGPAGAQGFVTVRDGHLAFEEGGRARFWGINLLNGAGHPPKEDGTELARQLAASGINLVRLHHFDAPRGSVVNPDRTSDPATLFDAEELDRFDWFVSELKRNGVYVLLEVATNRAFSEVDGVSNADASVANGHKLVPFFAADWRDAFLRWTRAWLGRTNPYTQLRYADDPVIAMVELVNENSVAMNWFTGGLESFSAPHRATLDARWNAFLATRYPDEAAVRSAWTGSVNPGLLPHEKWGAIQRHPVAAGFFDDYPLRRKEDLYDFYAGVDQTFLTDEARLVRELGYRVPIVPGVTYQSPMLARIQSQFDVIDIHLEWDGVGGEDTLRGASLVESPRAISYLDRFTQAQAGKPFIISETNGAFPNETTSELPFVYATMASVQDWDALIWLNYTNGPYRTGSTAVAGMYELRNAITKWAQFGVASALFRSGAVPAAPGLLPVYRSDAAVKAQTVSGARASLPEVRDVGFVLEHRIREAYGTVIPEAIAGAPSTEVGWWPDASRFVVDDDRWQVVIGKDRPELAGEGAGATRARFLDPQLGAFAATSFVSLDGKPFPSCRRALITVAGRMLNTGMTTGAGGTTVHRWGDGPSLVVPMTGEVRFAWPTKPTVRPRAADGTLGDPVVLKSVEKGWWALPVTGATTVWWEVG